MQYSQETRLAIRKAKDTVCKVRQEVKEATQEARQACEDARETARGRLGDPARQEAERHLRQMLARGHEEIHQTVQEALEVTENLKQAEVDKKAEADRVKEENAEPGFTSEVMQDLAVQLIDKFFSHTDGEPTLRRWSRNWWQWEDGAWDQKTDEEISDLVGISLTRPKPQGLAIQKLSGAAKEGILMELRNRLALPDAQEFQTWLPARNPDNRTLDLVPESDPDGMGEETWVSTVDSVIRVDRIIHGEKKPILKLDSTPRYWTTCSIPRVMAGALPSEWGKFLHEVLEGDEERYLLLQEWFGYCTLPSTRFQKLLMLVGEGGNGKSTVLNVLVAMIGQKNVSNCSLGNIADKHGTFVTFGKLVNSYDDISTRYMKETGQLKAFTGSGNVVFERKYCDPFSAKPTARLCFSMNAIPRTEDDSQGFWRRLLIMPFRFTPLEEKEELADLTHPDCPFPAEMDDIFGWSLVGLSRLLKNRKFTESKVCDAELEFWRSNNENVRRYAQERLCFIPGVIAKTGSTPVMVISEDYHMWNKVNREKPFSTQGMAQRLKRVFSDKGKLEQQNFNFGIKTLPYFLGLTLKSEAPSLST